MFIYNYELRQSLPYEGRGNMASILFKFNVQNLHAHTGTLTDAPSIILQLSCSVLALFACKYS